MFSSIEAYLFMIASGALAVIFYLLANLTGSEYESPVTGYHRPKKILSAIFSALMFPLGIYGFLFVIPYSFVSLACGYCRGYYRRKDLKLSFELGQLTSKPCYQQLSFAARNGSQEAAQALELLHDYRKELEAQAAGCSRNSEQARSISHSLYDMEHTHDWNDLPGEILHIFDVSQWISQKRDELDF